MTIRFSDCCELLECQMGNQSSRRGNCDKGKQVFTLGNLLIEGFHTLTLQIAALLIIVVAGLIFLAVSPSSHSAIAPDQLMQVFVA